MKKEPKQVQPYSLKPENIRWIRAMAQKLSTPENQISASAFLDGLIDAARAKTEQSVDPSPTRTEKKTARTASVALPA